MVIVKEVVIEVLANIRYLLGRLRWILGTCGSRFWLFRRCSYRILVGGTGNARRFSTFFYFWLTVDLMVLEGLSKA